MQADRGIWSRLANAHQWRQMSQKRQYWADRTHAAANPDMELYIAMDGGAGNDAVLPHLSAHDLELPNKALKDASTLPAKIMNGLIHGSVRSHVILSPGNLLTVHPRSPNTLCAMSSELAARCPLSSEAPLCDRGRITRASPC